jgi:hypothetical protein
MDEFLLETEAWGRQQFGGCELGDQRRTRRLVKVAAQAAADPSGSLPAQAASWGDVKAAYRLFDAEEVTFQAVAEPHWRHTRQSARGRLLVLGDTTELDFGIRRKVAGLGPTGNGGGWGFLLHSALVVSPRIETVWGLAAQKVHYRQPAPAGENTTQRLKRRRESEIWGEVIDEVGPAPPETEWVHVLDRAADNFEVFCHLRAQRAGWVIRAEQLRRKVRAPDGRTLPLQQFVSEQAPAGSVLLSLRARPGQPARTARLAVSYGRLELPPPAQQSPYVRSLASGPIASSVVWLREVDAPSAVRQPIEWILYSSLPVGDLAEALEVIRAYECRWLIEEYHKALKSGCQVTARQLKTRERLEALTGLLSVVAVRLLQLKSLARTTPERPAAEVVPPRWITMLQAVRRRRTPSLTVRDFYRDLAQLGGFLGRKSDGEPGWITLWRGWEKLHLLVRGSELANSAEKCG